MLNRLARRAIIITADFSDQASGSAGPGSARPTDAPRAPTRVGVQRASGPARWLPQRATRYQTLAMVMSRGVLATDLALCEAARSRRTAHHRSLISDTDNHRDLGHRHAVLYGAAADPLPVLAAPPRSRQQPPGLTTITHVSAGTCDDASVYLRYVSSHSVPGLWSGSGRCSTSEQQVKTVRRASHSAARSQTCAAARTASAVISSSLSPCSGVTYIKPRGSTCTPFVTRSDENFLYPCRTSHASL